MKELSIEEKAQAYDEAIERAIAWRKKYVNSTISEDGTMIQDFNNIFPELKESEDERIRNEIIAFVEQSIHRGGGTPIPQEQEDKWIAWLEKQGEQKPADEVEPRQEELTEFERAVKQVMEEAIECGDTHNLKADADMLLRLTQKPWSEEDEEKFRDVIRLVEQGAPVQSIRDHYTSWFKSLRERYTWKPSDEQIIELRRVISGCSYDIEPLAEMEEQLKKLREE